MYLFNILSKRESSTIQENRAYQNDKLINILDIAFENIKYYEKLEINTKDLSYDEFKKIPILTKEIIRNQSNVLVNPNFQQINEVIKNTSGGSTGEPLTFFRTKEQGYYGIANYYLALHQNGINIFDSSVDLWGAERDMYNTNSKFDIRSLFYNKITLNTFVLSDEIMNTYIHRLNKIKPKFIKAYVHSIYEISKYITKHNIKIQFKPVIHCTTGPLYPEMRSEIVNAFNDAVVYNFYGSREVSAIATEIKEQEGMFVLYDNVFIEILDKNDQQVKKGEEGEVVVTTLNNFYMPLLRYKIGDRAIKGDDLNFGTLKLDAVVGRTLGMIHREDGFKIDGQFFTSLFFGKKGIKNFQLIQKTILELELRIVKSDSYDPEELNSIINRIKKEMVGAEIKIIFCENINLTASGKIMYVYSEI